MRTISFANVVPGALVITSLLVGASPLLAAESASSVNFVNRDALSTTGTTGWRNPLRAGSAAADKSASTNSLRENVTPVSYEEEVAGSRNNGLKLRPHKEPSGIFSSMMGEGSKAFSKPATPSSAGKQPQFRQAAKPPATSKSSTKQALSMLPQFKSSAARQNAQVAAAAQTAANGRAGSVAVQKSYMPSQRSAAARTNPAYATNQGTYSSAAAAAQNYHPRTQPAGTVAARRPQPNTPPTKPIPPKRQVWNSNPNLARPTIRSPQPTAIAPPQPIATHEAGPMLDPSSPAGLLMQAHQLAATARTEDEFSKIYSLCQQVPARTATAEEAAFGRQLAAWALNRRGQLRAKSNNAEAAINDFSQAIRIDAKCWRALHNRGVLLAQAGQFEPAFDDFHQTIELKPDYAKAFANRGALYVLAGELEPALADYQQAVAIDPKFAIAERGCGRTCHMLGRIDEAYEHLTRAIELAPRDATAIASRGDLLTDMGEYEAAAADYDHAISLQPNFADAHRGSAWLLATCPDEHVRNPELALERAQKAVELERKADATTFDTLAAAQASVGDFQNAAATIRRAIEISPPSERSVYQDRMQLYRNSRRYVIEPVAAVQQAMYQR